jgi:hypothetical protein
VAGLAVSVMAVPGVTDWEHVAPQLMPAGVPTTVPEPVPLLVTDSVTGAKLNVAVTDIAPLTVTVQMPVPEQAPLQLAKDEPAAGVAVRVMAVPGVTGCEQVVPQSMPAGLLVTVPEPVPLLVTDSVIGRRLKVAVTDVAALTVTAQVPVPEQAPLQPAKDEPATGVAVRAMAVPGVTDCEQIAPQLMMPAGLPVTVPEPAPLFVTDSVTGTRLKVAVAVVAAFTVTAHVPVPEQAPLQPAKEEPAAGVAVRVMAVPGVTDCEQAVPQLMPAGLPVTVPEPVPPFVIDSVTGTRLNSGGDRLGGVDGDAQVPVPVQVSLQPAKDEPRPAWRQRRMAGPGDVAVQGAQLMMPAGLPLVSADHATVLDADGHETEGRRHEGLALTVTAQFQYRAGTLSPRRRSRPPGGHP